MDNAKRRITVLHIIDYDANGKKVIYLVKCLFLIDHLFVYGKEMLGSAVDLRLDTGLVDVGTHLLNQ